MRFGAPRSDSPSPSRRPRRPRPLRRSGFGVPSDSSDEASDSDASESASSSSSDSFCYASESEVPKPLPRAGQRGRSVSEQHDVEDMLASIRLRVAHHDVYEEWEHRTRKDAFVSARHEQAVMKENRRHSVETSQTRISGGQAAKHQQQLEEVKLRLSQFRGFQQQQELKMRAAWNERKGLLWQRIEGVIRMEEDKVKAQLEVERQRREEEERKRREVEERTKQEEQRVQEELLRKKKEEEEKEQQAAKEDEDRRRETELKAQNAAQTQVQEEERKAIGLTTSAEDWQKGRELLKKLKAGPMKTVKTDKAVKSVWAAGRRQITPKIGQLTNDPESINRITKLLIDIVRPSQPYPKAIYFALLSSLAKAILLQAETEVTAEKRSALPLAQVTAGLLGALDRFADVFWAKLCQRAGGWLAPHAIPPVDTDGTPFDEATRRKVLGYRKEETAAEFTTRVAGIARVYFHVLTVPVAQPLDPRFRFPRYWTFFARMLSEPQLLESPVAPEILYAALDVAGASARETWGAQWVKLLGILYDGVTTGLYGQEGHLIGGKSGEGTAARVRVQLEIERIVGAS